MPLVSCRMDRSGTFRLMYPSFVVVVSTSNVNHKIKLRSYTTRAGLPLDVTLVDAILATCATQGKFLPVTIGSGPTQLELMGGAMGAGNPCHEVVEEVLDRFKPNTRIAVILSIGSGHSGLATASSSTDEEWLKIMRYMVADCEKTAQEMRKTMGDDGVYFRFNVDQGLQEYHGAHVDRMTWVFAQTLAYLDDRETSRLLGQCVSGICQRQGLLALEELDKRIRNIVTHQTSCDGDIAFSNFMAKMVDTTDVLVLITVGCDLLRHIMEVAEVSSAKITVYVVYSMLQGNRTERQALEWHSPQARSPCCRPRYPACPTRGRSETWTGDSGPRSIVSDTASNLHEVR
jgi:hypothetical protein